VEVGAEVEVDHEPIFAATTSQFGSLLCVSFLIRAHQLTLRDHMALDRFQEISFRRR
jgi:hypothetical protein